MPPFHGQRMRLYGKQICDLALQHSRDLKPDLQLVAQDLMNKISLQAIIHLVYGVTAPAEVARLEELIEELRKSFSPRYFRSRRCFVPSDSWSEPIPPSNSCRLAAGIGAASGPPLRCTR
ncbi:hypothetical protein [Sorangium sp. So ce388]|uniref:hypothetical protein n=1 Tax=Sorangium sp. So ce388 TaxID=3133309 RepID=UPI003F5CA2F9